MVYDIVIIGGGPAGLTAGIYVKRAMLNAVLLEKMGIGGQIIVTDKVENFPGFLEISGADLAAKFEEQARKFGLEMKGMAEVDSIEDKGNIKIIKTTEGDIETKSVIIASGTTPKRLGAKGEVELTGRGVSYCATCDGFFFKEKEVVVIGGGDSAITEAIYLTKMAKKVTVVHRRNELRAEKINQEHAFSNPKISFIWDSVLEEIVGKNVVEKVVLKNLKTNVTSEVKTDGVFIYVGLIPNTKFADVKKDERGFIIANAKMETSVKGIFVAGDCRVTPLRQITTAVGDGAIAAVSAERYLEEL
ncbi:MAG: thioredoxin-disulfide reductase [Candidatus Methanoperedens sp.]|nr:thioredoxin-disulfide reductase [Candidatus Methanoperedens sp. BLZ2]KAB2948326.1 MAG: thioredoxin-disulfide reductase [Candidatus Methanoperedens sp.]MBZ0176476.1 thioredoxin-disulfide reductase [Candidatus Methanoperedens nitroreducens]MCX9077033.1 thioredoxin-disulfide reductase [Candidatus Methanoperedens sp.]